MRRGKRMRRSLAIFLVMAMLLTIVPWSPVLAAEAPPAEESRTEELPGAEAAEAPEQLPERDSFGGILQGSGEAELPAIHTGMPGEEEQVRVLVELEQEQEPLTKVTGALLDGALSPTGLARQEALLEQHGSIQTQIQALAEEREIEVRYDYTLLANGFSLACPYGLVDDIRAVDGVRSVELCQTYSLPTESQMNSGNEMIGSGEAWSLGLDGTGMVVAVVDTGLDTDHPAFAQDPGVVTLTQEKLEQLVEAKALRAQRISGVGAAGLRMSDKVPFAFDYAGVTQLTIGASVETIGDFAFYGCTKLTQVTLPDSVKSLGTSAFNKNSALKTFTFGTGLQSIGSMCFNMCYQLEAIQVPEGNTAFAARDGVLYSKSMDTVVWYPQGKTDTAYVMPETVKHIGPYGIYEVAALTSVTVSSGLETIDEFGLARLNITGTLSLPATVNSIHFKAFLYDYSLQGLETPGENATFQTRDGVLFTKDMSTLLVYPAGKPEISYTVPAGVRTVGTYAFYYASTIGSHIPYCRAGRLRFSRCC